MSYQFIKSPSRWDDSCHKHPCPETRRIDMVFNSMSTQDNGKTALIHLSSGLVSLGTEGARRRNDYCQKHRATDRHLETDAALGGVYAHETGAMTEIATLLHLGLPVSLAVNGEFHLSDARGDIEVRGSRRTDARLMFREKDKLAGKLGKKWILAIMPSNIDAAGLDVRLMGWAYGHEIAQGKYWGDPNGKGGAWWMPQKDLKPINSLPQ